MKTLFISLVALAIGLIAGIVYMEYKNATPAAASAETPPPPAASRASPPPIDDFDPSTEMRRMQQEMNRMFNQSLQQFQSNEPALNAPGYSLSLDVREFPDRFEVHASLPDAKASDINVKLDNDRTLTVEVSNQAKNTTHTTSRQSTTNTTSEEWGQYSQTIQLPSAVQVNKMKTEHKDHELVIILPKA